jgi:hypothetical protein
MACGFVLVERDPTPLRASQWWGQYPWVVTAGFAVTFLPTFLVFIFRQKIIRPSMKRARHPNSPPAMAWVCSGWAGRTPAPRIMRVRLRSTVNPRPSSHA